MLRLKNIVKTYHVASGDVPAIKGLTLNFRKNEFVSILGPSGCGKTTLLNIIGGLDKYTSGDLIIDGKSTKTFKDKDWDVYRNHRIGFIFQSYNLIPHQTVLGNVELALTIAGIGKEERRARAVAVLEKVGLKDQLSKRPNQLSGGQCQRVAIARALVNDPDILLADEPTGALDTVTSVQIMELMKEIARDKLVIMVTHNPELAEKYSTRIVRLLDGKLVSDSNAFSEVVEEYETERDRAVNTQREERKGRKNTKMGFFTAFKLSGRNLVAKKGRTIMVGFAGSIGIIGVAIVLAFSNGITNYINSMEYDMLSGFPVSITATGLDFSSLSSMTDSMSLGGSNKDSDRTHDKVYVKQVVKTITKLSSAITTNNITKDYVDYVDACPEDYYAVCQKYYGINYANNIYTDYSFGNGKEDDVVASVTGIRYMYSKILENTEDYSAYGSMINSLSTFQSLPNSEEYLIGERGQYNIKAGEFPEKDDKTALVLVLSANAEVNDMVLAQFGYVSEREFLNYVYYLSQQSIDENNEGKVDSEKEEDNKFYDPDGPRMQETYDYSKFVGEGAKTFTYYPNSQVYTTGYDALTGEINGFEYNTYKTEDMTGGTELKIKCVLEPKDNVSYGALSAGLYYTDALTEYMLSLEKEGAETESDIVKYARANNDEANNIKFSYHYYYDKEEDDGTINMNKLGWENNQDFGSNTSSSSSASTGTSSSSIAAMASMSTKDQFKTMVKRYLGQFGSTAEEQLDAIINMMADMYYSTSSKVVTLRALAGNDLPSSLYFYSNSFEEKNLLTAYLDEYNNKEGIEEKDKITYTDTLGLVMDLVNNLITIVTVGLTAFSSVSLVVSTVMIGIITYVSVVERVKEIGIIRAMGGRKKDIRNLFNAETFIIGFLAGLIGIGVTYLICAIFNTVIGANFGIYTIASLTIPTAAIMVTISVCLTLISGLIPASKAAKQDPVIALRTE